MKRTSQKGACSANVQAAKMNCLEHNRRNAESVKVPSYVNTERSHLNHTIFEDDMIRGRKSIVPLVKRAELLYKEKTGQKCQKSFTPFREDVLSLPCRGDITDEQIKHFIRMVEVKTGWKVIGAWYHKDEGYFGSKYIEGNEDFKTNFHVHVLYSCQDQETGKIIRPKRNYFSLRQDWLSLATGMLRGNRVEETGRKRRTADQERTKNQENRIDMLERKAMEREEDLKVIEQKIEEAKKQVDKEEKRLDEVRKDVQNREIRLATIKQEVIEKESHLSQMKSLKEWFEDVIPKAENDLETIEKEIDEGVRLLATKETNPWKDFVYRFSAFIGRAVDAIVARVNRGSIHFTSNEVITIDHAMTKMAYEDVEKRKDAGSWLLRMAKQFFTKANIWVEDEVKEIAECGINVRTEENQGFRR